MSTWLQTLNPFQSAAARKQAVTEAWKSAGVHIGSWGTPEFGVTEVLAGNAPRNTQGGSTLLNTTPQEYLPPDFKTAEQIKAQAVLGASTTGGGGNGGNNIPTNPIVPSAPDYSRINQQTNDYGALIDQEFNNTMGQLSNQEQGLQAQAGTAQQQIGNEYAGVKTQLGNEQAVNEQGIQGQLSTAEGQGSSAMQQARDLWRQTQQSNIAQLSALGISSSSVAEALAERLGVETARRIAGITGSVDEIRQNAVKELSRVKNYYQDKLTNLENQKATRLSEVQNSLIAGLNQINDARNQAATAKARSRIDLFTNAQNAIAGLQSQYDNFKYQLAMWAQQKADAVTPITTNPDYYANIQKNQNVINQNFATSGFTYVPNFNAQGQVTGYSRQSKKPDLNSPYDPTDPNYWQSQQ